MARKALHSQNEVFAFEREGKVEIWDYFAEEIVAAMNNGLESKLTHNSPPDRIYRALRKWMGRYLEEGITDGFLDDLNAALHEIRYSKYVLPVDLLPSGSGFPRSAYVAQYNTMPAPEAYAADDFSKLLTSGMLERLKLCQLEGCEKFFLGPPQAKWCSKTCGSKYRVREKRKRESS